jgi:hypothetical protein
VIGVTRKVQRTSPRKVVELSFDAQRLAGQLIRVQVWPPQNMPPKAQP